MFGLGSRDDSSVTAPAPEFEFSVQAKLLQQQQDAAHWRYRNTIKTMATVRKLLTPPRSPVEIATRFGSERPGVRLREASVEAGVPVSN